MSRNGQTRTHEWDPPPGDGVLQADFDLPSGTWFDWHTHDHHQLAWATRGTVVVRVGDQHWVLPPARALWLPAGTPHRTGAAGDAVLRGIYADPARCPIGWRDPRMVRVRPLLSELLDYLTAADLPDDRRNRAEALVFDLLEPAEVAPIEVPVPADPRARRVARTLLAHPDDPRDLAALGRMTGASARTLARLWTTETRMTFGRWRTHARLRAALPLLAAGLPIESVARRVGYSSPSAFTAAFRRTVGVPPRAYVTP
jgi:AraC-like DNA-binding protein